MTKYTWQQLAVKHGNWRALSAAISVSGVPLRQKGWIVDSVECECSVEMEADACTITLQNVYDRKNSCFTCENDFVLGAPVKIGLGYGVSQTVFSGYLYEVNYRLGEQNTATMRCMDVKGAMMGGASFFPQGGMTYQEGIEAMFPKTGGRYDAVCSAPKLAGISELSQLIDDFPEEPDDYFFLARAMERLELECFVRGGALLIRKKPSSAAAPALLQIGQDTFLDLSVGFSTVGYVESVTVRGATDDERDQTKKVVEATAKNTEKIRGQLIGGRKAEVFSASTRDAKRAKEEAEAKLRRRKKRSGDVQLTVRGLPELAPGYYVELSGISPKLNGLYYIAGVSHRMDQQSYITTLDCRKD